MKVNKDATQFEFPTTLTQDMEFYDEKSILRFIDFEAIARGIPVSLYARSVNKTTIILTCKTCLSKLNFAKGGTKWTLASFSNIHTHGLSIRIPVSVLSSDDLKEMRYSFPTSFQLSMKFGSAQEVINLIQKEAYERELPLNIYSFEQRKKPTLALTCKICKIGMKFRTCEEGLELYQFENEHNHGPDELEAYQESRQGKGKERKRLKERKRKTRSIDELSQKAESLKQQEESESKEEQQANDPTYQPTSSANVSQPVVPTKKTERLAEQSSLMESTVSYNWEINMEAVNMICPLTAELQKLGYQYRLDTQYGLCCLVLVTPTMKRNYAVFGEGMPLNFQLFYNLVSNPSGSEVGIFWIRDIGNDPLLVGVTLLTRGLRIQSSWEVLFQHLMALRDVRAPPSAVFACGLRSPSIGDLMRGSRTKLTANTCPAEEQYHHNSAAIQEAIMQEHIQQFYSNCQHILKVTHALLKKKVSVVELVGMIERIQKELRTFIPKEAEQHESASAMNEQAENNEGDSPEKSPEDSARISSSHAFPMVLKSIKEESDLEFRHVGFKWGTILQNKRS